MTDETSRVESADTPGEEPTPAPPSGEADTGAPESDAPDVGEPDAAEPDSAEQAVEDIDSEDEIDQLGAMKDSLAALTNDLQRLQAEYANYRKRVDRDRDLVRENAAYQALTPVIEVLDTIDRAKEHGELDPGFKAVADQLERAVAVSGLSRFGEPGEEFDPNLHEALSHLGTDPEVTVTTIKHVAKAGYTIGPRVVRAAQVLVVDPQE